MIEPFFGLLSIVFFLMFLFDVICTKAGKWLAVIVIAICLAYLSVVTK